MTIYQNNIEMLTPINSQLLAEAEQSYGAAWVCDAITEAVKANVRKWKYIEAILKRWKADGRGDNRKPATEPEYRSLN